MTGRNHATLPTSFDSRVDIEHELSVVERSDATDAVRKRRFTVRQRDRIYLVKADEVDWIEAAGNYVRLHTTRGEFLIRDTLIQLEKTLDPAQFARIHRGAIVNLDRIAEIRTAHFGDYQVTLATGERLRLSRHYRSRVIG